MNKKYTAMLVVFILGLLIILAVMWQSGMAQPGAANQQVEAEPTTQLTPEPTEVQMDPQKLLIPRWFLESMVVDGESIELLQDRQTIQFEPGGRANGFGGCNDYFTTYQAMTDGSMAFSEIGATKMLCEIGSTQETAYFNALAKVTNYSVVGGGKLTLSSADGQTVLTFTMPPK